MTKIKTKVCTKCKIEKELSRFYKERKNKDGKMYKCIACVKQYGRNNKERIKEYNTQYIKNNKERAKQYRLDHKEEISSRGKRWYNDNKEEIAMKAKKYQKKNRSEISAYAHQYYQANREKILERMKRRRKEDINYKMTCVLRVRLKHALRATSVKKTTSAMELIGCSPNELKRYLEGEFTEGMSWDNYGSHGWHIDHILPCISFDLTDEEQQRQCFHYTNLQPLWAEDNYSKGTNILYPHYLERF